MDFLKKTVYGVASTIAPNVSPIWDAIKTGDFWKLNPANLALALREQSYQYNELLKEIHNAFLYKNMIAKYIGLVSIDEFETCSKRHFDQTFAEFGTLIDMLVNTNSAGIMPKLKATLTALNVPVEIYNTHPGNKDQAFTNALTQIRDKIQVDSWPAWYRIELNSSINKINMALAGLYLAKLWSKERKEASCDRPGIPQSLLLEPLPIVYPRHPDLDRYTGPPPPSKLLPSW
jgi:hypothetical protein